MSYRIVILKGDSEVWSKGGHTFAADAIRAGVNHVRDNFDEAWTLLAEYHGYSAHLTSNEVPGKTPAWLVE